MTKKKGDMNHDTPLKAQISRHFQSLGESSVRGAASATARRAVMATLRKRAAMMLKNFNIVLKKQPGNTPMYNILDLTI